ncbi:MAG: DUF3570 domain-containing protein [Polyangiales bacterium]
MRLQLTAALAMVAATHSRCATTPAQANRAELSLHAGGYADNDHVYVANPSVRARVAIGPRVVATGSYGVDIISAASVDVVASASRSTEQRHEANLGASVAIDARTSIACGVRGSREPDYQSNALSFSFDRETTARDLALHVEVRGRYDRVGPGWTLTDAAPLWAASASASVTRVLDRRSILRLAAQGEVLVGLQSSVYRYVPVGGVFYVERVPSRRARGAVEARWQRSILSNLAVSAELGISVDSWALVAPSVDVALRWEPSAWALLELSARAMTQNGAFFYDGTYLAHTEWRTRDRALGPMHTFWPTITARFFAPAWPAPNDWELGVRAGWMHQAFDDYVPLRTRDAAVAELWLTRLF